MLLYRLFLYTLASNWIHARGRCFLLSDLFLLRALRSRPRLSLPFYYVKSRPERPRCAPRSIDGIKEGSPEQQKKGTNQPLCMEPNRGPHGACVCWRVSGGAPVPGIFPYLESPAA